MTERSTILLIDDESANQALIARALERDGYHVVGALDAATGMAAFQRESPDLVLLDLMLPDMDGREVCRLIRNQSDVPIIMVTALDEEVDKVIGLEIGADDYITKPFGMRELRSRVRALLRRALRSVGSETGGGEESRLELGGIALDSERRNVTARGEPVILTYVEFEILRALMLSPGRVFSRRQLLEGIWGSSDYREPRTVDVHIRHLREKIEVEPSEPLLIQTVRGVGYRFGE
jgi:DNA-binding response OmpR family regulator